MRDIKPRGFISGLVPPLECRQISSGGGGGVDMQGTDWKSVSVPLETLMLTDIMKLLCVIIVHIRGESLVLSIYLFKSYTRNTDSMLQHS